MGQTEINKISLELKFALKEIVRDNISIASQKRTTFIMNIKANNL